jgi:hypothetical protein
MMEAVSTSETSVFSTKLHGATFQKTVFILIDVRTYDLRDVIILHDLTSRLGIATDISELPYSFSSVVIL